MRCLGALYSLRGGGGGGLLLLLLLLTMVAISTSGKEGRKQCCQPACCTAKNQKISAYLQFWDTFWDRLIRRLKCPKLCHIKTKNKLCHIGWQVCHMRVSNTGREKSFLAQEILHETRSKEALEKKSSRTNSSIFFLHNICLCFPTFR